MNVTESENKDVPEEAQADGQETQQEEKPQLSLNVTVESLGACERHVTIEVSREDIDRYMEEEFAELAPKAEVPGFRPGKAPRKLVVSRFKDHVKEQVKGKLLLDSMAQANDIEHLAAISEPDLDYDAVKLPDDGPMTFEFDLEVRPEFDLPEWKGLNLTKSVRTIDDDDVDRYQKRVLRRYASLDATDEPAAVGDVLELNIVFKLDDEELSKVEEQKLVLKEKLSLPDAEFDGFGEFLTGVKKGEQKTVAIKISDEAQAEELQGKEVQATFEVLGVQRLNYPELSHKFLDEIGGFVDEQDLKEELRQELERQTEYRSQQGMREQITEALLAGADWDLPKELLKRQAGREAQRMRLELQASGFGEDMIKAYENNLLRNSLATTAKALKEHFIFERIAEDEKIEADDDDYDNEIKLIAEREGLPARRVRARLEKRGEMDALRNQIVERRVIELITSHGSVTEDPVELPPDDTAVLDHAIAKVEEESAIPEAKHGEEPKPVPGQAVPPRD